MGNSYDIGDCVRMRASFLDEHGNLIDPATVMLTVKVHGKGQHDISVVREGIGAYYGDWTIADPGVHHYKWEAAGLASDVGEFFARHTVF